MGEVKKVVGVVEPHLIKVEPSEHRAGDESGAGRREVERVVRRPRDFRTLGGDGHAREWIRVGVMRVIEKEDQEVEVREPTLGWRGGKLTPSKL